MIAHARFPGSARVRTLRFSPRSTVPLEAACVVANGVRETLRELFHEACEVVVGEPSAVTRDAWRILAHDALLFLTRGRQTDIVLVVPRADARLLVLRAFGEGTAPGQREPTSTEGCSALELRAIERIAVRCAISFDPLCAERRSPTRAVAYADVPTCAAYFDVRVRAPIPLVLGVGIVRPLPDGGPAGRLATSALEDVRVPVSVTFATATVDTASFLQWTVGDIVACDTRLTGMAALRVAGRTLATGMPGVAGARAALRIGAVAAC